MVSIKPHKLDSVGSIPTPAPKFPDCLMVGHKTLNLVVVVRAHLWKPKNTRVAKW